MSTTIKQAINEFHTYSDIPSLHYGLRMVEIA
jgi:hypothetical protein